MLNPRQTDIQTVQTILHVVSSVLRNWLHINNLVSRYGQKFVMCARSAAYSVMELHLNTMYHAAKKRGRGVANARGVGGGGHGAWLGTCGQHWASNENIYVVYTGARVMGVSMVIAAWGEGVM